jgi:hypothetical protein
VVTTWTTCFNIKILAILPTECIYEFHTEVTRNSDYFPNSIRRFIFVTDIQLCVLRGRNWIWLLLRGTSGFTFISQRFTSSPSYLSQEDRRALPGKAQRRKVFCSRSLESSVSQYIPSAFSHFRHISAKCSLNSEQCGLLGCNIVQFETARRFGGTYP